MLHLHKLEAVKYQMTCVQTRAYKQRAYSSHKNGEIKNQKFMLAQTQCPCTMYVKVHALYFVESMSPSFRLTVSEMQQNSNQDTFCACIYVFGHYLLEVSHFTPAAISKLLHSCTLVESQSMMLSSFPRHARSSNKIFNVPSGRGL